VEHVHAPTRTRGYGSGRVNPRVRVYPQSSKTSYIKTSRYICCIVCIIFVGKLYGNYLITAYLAVKLLYLGNAVGQLFMLDAFLKIDYHLYGVQVVERLIRGQDWGYSERFPRVTLCEFEIRHQSRVHQYVVQCALTINLFEVSGFGLRLVD